MLAAGPITANGTQAQGLVGLMLVVLVVVVVGYGRLGHVLLEELEAGDGTGGLSHERALVGVEALGRCGRGCCGHGVGIGPGIVELDELLLLLMVTEDGRRVLELVGQHLRLFGNGIVVGGTSLATGDQVLIDGRRGPRAVLVDLANALDGRCGRDGAVAARAAAPTATLRSAAHHRQVGFC